MHGVKACCSGSIAYGHFMNGRFLTDNGYFWFEVLEELWDIKCTYHFPSILDITLNNGICSLVASLYYQCSYIIVK